MYVWTGYGNLIYGGNTFLGVGHFGPLFKTPSFLARASFDPVSPKRKIFD